MPTRRESGALLPKITGAVWVNMGGDLRVDIDT
jgi:hypothetical protein